MTKDMMTLCRLLKKSSDTELLREMASVYRRFGDRRIRLLFDREAWS